MLFARGLGNPGFTAQEATGVLIARQYPRSPSFWMRILSLMRALQCFRHGSCPVSGSANIDRLSTRSYGVDSGSRLGHPVHPQQVGCMYVSMLYVCTMYPYNIDWCLSTSQVAAIHARVALTATLGHPLGCCAVTGLAMVTEGPVTNSCISRMPSLRLQTPWAPHRLPVHWRVPS